MGLTVTWLHLSDLHACKAKTGWDAHGILKDLQTDLQQMQARHGLRPDLIFFTGDAAYGHIGKGRGETLRAQYREVASFLEGVRTAFNPEVQRENVFLVPGNHDVKRSSVTPDQTDWLDKSASAELITEMIQTAGKQWLRYMERLEEYRKFLEANGYSHLLADPDRLSYCALREVNGLSIGVAGINSVWSSGRDGEKGKLWLGGRFQIGQLEPKIEKAMVRIALTHHPMSWFRQGEDPDVKQRIEGSFHFHLHGHEHQGWVDANVDGHTRIAAAACYDRADPGKETGYNFVRLDLDTRRSQVWLREYKRKGAGGWGPMLISGKTNNNGMWPLRNLKWLKTEKRIRGRSPTGRTKPAVRSFITHHVPPSRPLFVGRGDLLKDTIRRLASGGSVALSAEGLPGVGKTALAIAVAHAPEVRDRFDGVLWAGLGREPDVMGILAGWAEALGRDVSRLATEAERAQAVTDAIGQRLFLLVIDDAWALDPARRLRCGGPNSCHLLTTRDKGIARQFAMNVGVIEVPVLEPGPAYDLLAALAPDACAADPETARGLAEAVGGLPLALELLGGYLAAPERSEFSELGKDALTELADPGVRLRLAQERLGAASAGKMTLQAMIELSLEDLAGEVAGAFYSLGAFAPRPEQFDRGAALAVAGTDLKGLALLISRSLVTREVEKLSIHQALSDAARARMPAEAEARHRGYYLSLVNEGRGDWRRIEGCYGQIKRAWTSVPEDETLLELVWALRVFQERRGLWSDYLTWANRALSLSEAKGWRQNTGTLLNNMGGVYHALGQREKALEYYRQALPIREEVGDRAGKAATLNNMGLVYDALGQREKALDYYRQALPIVEEVGDRAGMAATLNNIGAVYDALGQREKALDYYRQALPIREEVGDRAGKAATLNNIGGVYNALGQREKALEYYRQALPIMEEVGDRAGKAATLNNMGLVYNALGQREKALGYYRQALPIREEVGDHYGESITRYNLAMVYRGQGRLPEAVAELRKVVELDKLVQHPDLEADRSVLAQVEAELARQGGSPH